MSTKITLSEQEFEFAVTCRDFLKERNPHASEQIELEGDVLTVPDDVGIRKAFLDYGVARLYKVFQLAIDNKAIALERVPLLISDLARFNEKIVGALVPPPANHLQ